MKIIVKDNRDNTVLRLIVAIDGIEGVPVLEKDCIEGGWLKDVDGDVCDYWYTIQLKDDVDILEHYSTDELLDEIKGRCEP